MIWLLVLAAIAFVLWPAEPKVESKPSILSGLPALPPRESSNGYIETVKALQMVRGRLAATDKLDEAAQKCLDTLTLALLAGSDR